MWHKEFVLHVLNMMWKDGGSQIYVDLSVLHMQSSSWSELFSEFVSEETSWFSLRDWERAKSSLSVRTMDISPGWTISDYRIKLFLMSFIVFRQRSWPCPRSSLGRRLAVLKKVAGLQRVAHTIERRIGGPVESWQWHYSYSVSLTATNSCLPWILVSVGGGRQALRTDSDSSHVLFC